MIQGWKIFAYCVKQVFGNFGIALRLSIVPSLLQVLTVGMFVGWAAVRDIGGIWQLLDSSVLPVFVIKFLGFTLFIMWFGVGAIVSFFLMILIVTALGQWIAVGWHRFVLVGERPALFPTLHAGRIADYFGKSLLIGFVVMVPTIVVSFTFAGAISQAGVARGGLLTNAVFVAGLVTTTVMFYRLATVLPGAALQPGVSFGTGWTVTRGQTGAILTLVIIFGVALQVLSLIGNLLAGVLPLRIVWFVISNWLTLMIGISILTTLYGHYVEKRPLV